MTFVQLLGTTELFLPDLVRLHGSLTGGLHIHGVSIETFSFKR